MEVNTMNRDVWGRLSATDRCVAVGAAIVFVAGFLPWWGYKGPLALYGASVAGWSSGFTAWAGIILLVAAGAFHTARALGVSVPELRVGPAVAVAGAAAVGLLLVIIRWLTLPRVHEGLAGSVGARFGIWVAIIAGAVELAAAVSAFRTSGERVPWAQPDQS
jgi:hypothetical protein